MEALFYLPKATEKDIKEQILKWLGSTDLTKDEWSVLFIYDTSLLDDDCEETCIVPDAWYDNGNEETCVFWCYKRDKLKLKMEHTPIYKNDVTINITRSLYGILVNKATWTTICCEHEKENLHYFIEWVTQGFDLKQLSMKQLYDMLRLTARFGFYIQLNHELLTKWYSFYFNAINKLFDAYDASRKHDHCWFFLPENQRAKLSPLCNLILKPEKASCNDVWKIRLKEQLHILSIQPVFEYEKEEQDFFREIVLIWVKNAQKEFAEKEEENENETNPKPLQPTGNADFRSFMLALPPCLKNICDKWIKGNHPGYYHRFHIWLFLQSYYHDKEQIKDIWYELAKNDEKYSVPGISKEAFYAQNNKLTKQVQNMKERRYYFCSCETTITKMLCPFSTKIEDIEDVGAIRFKCASDYNSKNKIPIIVTSPSEYFQSAIKHVSL